MARRPSPPPTPPLANLTVDQMRRGVDRLKKRIAELEQFNPDGILERGAPEIEALGTAIEETLSRVFGHDTVEYRRYAGAAVLDSGPISFTGELTPISSVREYLRQGRASALALLGQAVRGLEEEIAEATATTQHTSSQEPSRTAETSPPTYARKTILAAADMLKALGHTEFDRFLLEIDVPDGVAGRAIGGLLGRTTALAKYAIDNPTAITQDGITIPYAIIKRAIELYKLGAEQGHSEADRYKFEAAMKEEGQSENLRNDQEGIPEALQERARSAYASAIAGGSEVNRKPGSTTLSRKVFVVHGRDEGAKNAVELFLRTIGIDPIILHKQAHRGRHLLTKFAEEAAGVAFAVVLMTPDDEGCEKGGTPNPRARQNVVFELGFFIGKFETARVAALIAKGVEKPSDFDGIGYIDFDATGGWKNLLASELEGAGVPFDAHAVLRA